MHYYEVAPTKIVRLDKAVFTYSSAVSLDVGQIVRVEIGKKIMTGVITQAVQEPSFKTKEIAEIVNAIVPIHLLDLARWMSDYYQSHLSTCIALMVPPNPQINRRKTLLIPLTPSRNRTNFLFTPEQEAALKKLRHDTTGTSWLQGVTGSGKTSLYVTLAKDALENGRSAIILSPEIALTSQIVAEFSTHFDSGSLFVLHSSLTEAERAAAWAAIAAATKPVIVIGARSALFAPVSQVGLIVLDEAHEPGYKQDQSPKYSALRVASILGQLCQARVVFGSATPPVAERYYAEQQDRPIIKLTKRARSDSTVPDTTVVDMTDRSHFTSHRFLSKELVAGIEAALKAGKQSLIFHNRRGTASTGLCDNCGHAILCPNCFVPLTLHADKHKMVCHICNHSRTVPPSCPNCHQADIVFKGFGTKMIEAEIKKLFPHARIGRFDADNTKQESLGERYDDLYRGRIDIAIGTQVVAKGLDLPHLRFVGVIQADVGLALPDFNSAERTFQLLYQVVGRVGRSRHKTGVVVQTYQPSHPSIQYGLSQDYEAFYEQTLKTRQLAKFPPFSHILKLTCAYKQEATAIRAAQQLATRLRQTGPNSLTILGPSPAFYERLGGNYRWQLVVRSHRRQDLAKLINEIPTAHWQYDLDPASLL